MSGGMIPVAHRSIYDGHLAHFKLRVIVSLTTANITFANEKCPMSNTF